MTSPHERLADRNWRLKNSAWIAGTIVCCGFSTWASFLYVGISAKRRDWLIAASGYALATVAFSAMIGSAPRLPGGEADTSSWQSNVGTLLAVGVCVGGFVHALVINRSWLKFKAAKDETPWFVDGANAASVPAAQPAARDAYGFGVDANQYFSNAPAPPSSGFPARAPAPPPNPPGYPPAPPPPNPPPFAPVPPAPPAAPSQSQPAQAEATREGVGPDGNQGQALIDVNIATLADLLGRAGLDAETAERTIVERHRRGGFQNLDEFVVAAQVPPHVYAKVRNVLTVSAPTTTAPQPGRPNGTYEQGGGGGRVLDV